jgi:hypothetical protein
LVLAAAGASALHLTLPVTLAMTGLLVVLVVSYCQVITVHPDGGGAYAVGKKDLGATVSLLAAASLVVDYVLTVAVSTCRQDGDLAPGATCSRRISTDNPISIAASSAPSIGSVR